jgi:glycosyltransferase involved in cell wall biosynthesis
MNGAADRRPREEGKPRPKLALITDKCYPFFVGGYEGRFFEFACRLAARYEVRVFTAFGTPPPSGLPFSFVRLASTFGRRAEVNPRSLVDGISYALSFLRNPFQTWRPDVALLESIPYLHLPLAVKNLTVSRIPYILDVNEAWTRPHGRSIRDNSLVVAAIGACMSVALPRAALVTAVSTVTIESLVDNYSVDRSRVALLPDGIPERTGRTDAAGSPEGPAPLVKTYDFVMLGRLDPIKRHADFLEALGILKVRGWKGVALVIGDGPLRRDLLAQRDSLGLADSVVFTGRVESSERDALLRTSRVYVLCSEREGISRSTLEAMAQGLPCVVAVPHSREVFGVSDLVKDGYNGAYFEVGNIGELTESMSRLLSDSNLASLYGDRSKVRSESYYWGDISDRLDRLLSGLVSSGEITCR